MVVPRRLYEQAVRSGVVRSRAILRWTAAIREVAEKTFSFAAQNSRSLPALVDEI
jgi:hypothetical protein